MFDE
jgi:hypothetical protein